MWHRLAENAHDLYVFAATSLTFGFLKVIFSTQKETPTAVVASLVGSICLGTLAGLTALSANLADELALAIASGASLIAERLISGIVNNSDYVFSLFKRAAENLIDKYTR